MRTRCRILLAFVAGLAAIVCVPTPYTTIARLGVTPSAQLSAVQADAQLGDDQVATQDTTMTPREAAAAEDARSDGRTHEHHVGQPPPSAAPPGKPSSSPSA